MNKVANDNTLMTFGQYQGQSLANVPASFLLWCWYRIHPHSSTYKTNKHIFAYIEENLEDLKEECKKES